MRRRDFIGLLISSASCWCGSARAQPRRKPFLVAVLIVGSQAGSERHRSQFAAGLEELGYLQGRDYLVEERFGDGVMGRLPDLAQELVALEPDLFLAGSTSAAVAATQLTRTIPVVSPALVDPIAQGLAASYSRPGGMVTGIAIATDTLPGKQLELAVELVPGPGKIGLLSNAPGPAVAAHERAAFAAASQLGVELMPVDVRAPSDLEAAFETLTRAAPKALLVLPHPMFLTERHRIAMLALQNSIPAIYGFREEVEAGGLISYGIDISNAYRRVANHVDKIVRGTHPGDIPVEFPSKMELLINLRTARALQLEIPPSLLARADEVME